MIESIGSIAEIAGAAAFSPFADQTLTSLLVLVESAPLQAGAEGLRAVLKIFLSQGVRSRTESPSWHALISSPQPTPAVVQHLPRFAGTALKILNEEFSNLPADVPFSDSSCPLGSRRPGSRRGG